MFSSIGISYMFLSLQESIDRAFAELAQAEAGFDRI
jgi:hypothetical protein